MSVNSVTQLIRITFGAQFRITLDTKRLKFNVFVFSIKDVCAASVNKDESIIWYKILIIEILHEK